MSRVLHRLGARLRQSITRGRVLTSKLTAIRTMLQVAGMNGETFNNVELLLPLGMSGLPKSGKLVLLQVGNSRSHLVALCADDAVLRITDLQPGEFGWKDYNAQRIVFRNGMIEIVSPTLVNINGVDIDPMGNIVTPGTITAAGEVTANGGHTVSHHIHTDPQGGSVGLPTG